MAHYIRVRGLHFNGHLKDIDTRKAHMNAETLVFMLLLFLRASSACLKSWIF